MFWGVSDQKVFCQFMNNLYKHLNLLFLLVCHVCVQRISFIIMNISKYTDETIYITNCQLTP